ncbi:MAG: hypothetical protein IH600_01660 [Bacteroidetes bacterium]|nr:hypothetical protein [Bacteroidota bacterium]
MRTAPFLFVLALILVSCSSTPPRPVFSDFMEIREIKTDDPLAAKFSTMDGDEYRLGDPIVSGKSVSRLQVKRMSDEQFDLHVTLLGADDSRWRRFARSKGRQAALVVDGSIRCIFNVVDPGPPVENELLVVRVPDVAQTQEEADKLDTYLEEGKAAKRKKTEG